MTTLERLAAQIAKAHTSRWTLDHILELAELYIDPRWREVRACL